MAPWTFTILCGAHILFLGDSADLQHGAGAVNDDGQQVYGPNLWISFACWLKNTLPGFAKDELGHGLTGDTAFKGRYVIWRSQMDGGEGREEQGQTWKKGTVRDLRPTPCSSQRPGLAGPRSGWDHLWGAVQSKGSGFGLTWVTPPLPVSRRVTLGLQFFIWEVGREEHRTLSAHRQFLSVRGSTLAHEKPGQGGCFRGGGPRGQAGGQPQPDPTRSPAQSRGHLRQGAHSHGQTLGSWWRCTSGRWRRPLHSGP